MYNFKLWSKNNITRFYISPGPEQSYVFLSKQNLIEVVSPDPKFKAEIISYLEKHLHFSLEKTHLIRKSLADVLKRLPNPKKNNTDTSWLDPENILADAVQIIATSKASINSKKHFANTIKMLERTKKNVVGTIDTREAPETVKWYIDGAIPCERKTLAIGDLRYENEADKVLLIFERKTIQDFNHCILNSRAHSQAERLYAHAEEMRADGWRVMVCWLIIESETQTLYDTLPETKQMDGMINYLSGILGQYVFHVFNDQHGAYLANKLVQGFNELKLTIPVKSESGQRVDIPKKAMKIQHSDHGGNNDHNVRTAATNQLLYVLTSFSSINMTVAKALAATGKPLHQILLMTEEELKSVDGIGATLAAKIRANFSSV